MAQRALRDDPDEVRGGLDVLRERALVLEARPVHEPRDVLADRGARDGLPGLDDGPGEVDAEHRTRLPVVVDVCPVPASKYEYGWSMVLEPE